MNGVTYPETDYDRGRRILSLLGSYWAEIFDDRDRLQAHLRSSGHEQGQTHLNFLETVACLSRFSVPVFHTENWHVLVLNQNDAQHVPSVYKSGDLVYGPQSGAVPGRAAGFIQTYGGRDELRVVKVPLPSPLVDLPVSLQNLVVNPSAVLVKGTDYWVESRESGPVLVFRDDPFTNSLIPKRDVLNEAGQAVDLQIALWAYKGQFDLDYVYTQFGYVLGLQLKSSKFYKDLLNAWWDQFVEGFSVKHLQKFLAALSGAPVSLEVSETVEVVQKESDSWLIVTDKQVYRVPLGATVTVAVGDVLRAGDALSDAFEIIELGGAALDLGSLPALAFGKNFLSGDYYGELSFRNTLVTVQYSEDRTSVTFEVNGFPMDVELFWQTVQTRGEQSGQTLAQALADNPTTINPLKFVLENLMCNNLFVIRVRQASFAPGAPGIELFRLLRGVIPPHITYVVFIEVAIPQESLDLSQPGDENSLGASESVHAFLGTQTLLDAGYEVSMAVPGTLTYGDSFCSAKLVSSVCQ